MHLLQETVFQYIMLQYTVVGLPNCGKMIDDYIYVGWNMSINKNINRKWALTKISSKYALKWDSWNKLTVFIKQK